MSSPLVTTYSCLTKGSFPNVTKTHSHDLLAITNFSLPYSHGKNLKRVHLRHENAQENSLKCISTLMSLLLEFHLSHCHYCYQLLLNNNN